MEALGDAVELRQEVLGESMETVEEQKALRQADLSKTIKHKGFLALKSTNRLTGMTSWREYLFALTPGIDQSTLQYSILQCITPCCLSLYISIYASPSLLTSYQTYYAHILYIFLIANNNP